MPVAHPGPDPHCIMVLPVARPGPDPHLPGYAFVEYGLLDCDLGFMVGLGFRCRDSGARARDSAFTVEGFRHLSLVSASTLLSW